MNKEASTGRLREGVKLIFDQKAPSSRSSSRSSSSSGSSYSSSRGSRSTRRSRSSSRSSSSDSGSSSRSRSRSRSRSHPRCSGRSRCRHRHHSPPRHYRARSRSFSRSPERSSHRRRYHHRSRSPSPYGYSRRSPSRSRSRSPVYWRGSRFVGRYRCRFSRSPRSSRDYRSRSRSRERSAVRLSLEEKRYLLNVAKANATRILGVQNLELPASLKELEEEDKRRSSSDKEERVSADRAPQKTPTQANVVASDDSEAEASLTSPNRTPINFSVNNNIARPSNSPKVHDSKVTSRADSVADRKPYGHWVPISRSSSKK